MRKSRYKIKHLTLKVMAVVVAFCYMVEPAHDRLLHAFHFIYHSLEIPDHAHLQDNDVSCQNIDLFHRNHINHNHEILNFIDKIIGSSSEKDKHQGQPLNEISGTKKIIVHYRYDLEGNSFLNSQRLDNFKIMICLNNKGHSLQLYRPPQLMGNI